MGILVTWLLFSAVPAMVANNKNRSWVVWYFISLLISPLISLIVLIAIGDKEEDDTERQVSVRVEQQGDDTISKLERLRDLREDGTLTEEEFQEQKAKLLDSSG